MIKLCLFLRSKSSLIMALAGGLYCYVAIWLMATQSSAAFVSANHHMPRLVDESSLNNIEGLPQGQKIAMLGTGLKLPAQPSQVTRTGLPVVVVKDPTVENMSVRPSRLLVRQGVKVQGKQVGLSTDEPILAFSKALIDTAIQSPLNSLIQIFNALLSKPLNDFCQAVDHQPYHMQLPAITWIKHQRTAMGTPSWYAQMTGEAIGIVLPFSAVNKSVAVLAPGLHASLAHSRILPGLCVPVESMAFSGALYEGLLSPVDANNPNQLLARIFQAIIGAITFGSLISSYGILRYAAGLTNVPFSPRLRISTISEFSRFALAGTVAGLIYVQAYALISSGASAEPEALANLVLIFTMVGLLLGIGPHMSNIAKSLPMPYLSDKAQLDRLKSMHGLFKDEIEFRNESLAHRLTKIRHKRTYHRPAYTGPLQETMWKRRLEIKLTSESLSWAPSSENLDMNNRIYHNTDLTALVNDNYVPSPNPGNNLGYLPALSLPAQ
jgi:hypothetical protein